MLKDVTLGQYFPGQTPIHKLDPRTKLVFVILYIVVLFFQLCNQRLEFLVIVRQLMSGPAFHDLLDQISQKMKRPENFFCLLLGSREASNHENKEEYDDFR